MIFTRVVVAVFTTAVCARALYVPDVLYGRDLEDSRDVAARELSERGLIHLDTIRDLTERGDVVVLATRDLADLELRSEDILSHLIVARARTPSPGPYECKTKTDCQKKIDFYTHQKKGAQKSVKEWKKALKDAGNDAAKKRTAKNNLDTAQGAFENAEENIEVYTKMKAEKRS